MNETTPKAGENKSSTSRGRGRGGFRGRGRGRAQFNGQQRQSNEQRNSKNEIQCYQCKKYGHVKADCWYRDQQVNYAAANEEESRLFMAYCDTNEVTSDMWFVDNGCSNHMSGIKGIFKELDETKKNSQAW